MPAVSLPPLAYKVMIGLVCHSAAALVRLPLVPPAASYRTAVSYSEAVLHCSSRIGHLPHHQHDLDPRAFGKGKPCGHYQTGLDAWI